MVVQRTRELQICHEASESAILRFFLIELCPCGFKEQLIAGITKLGMIHKHVDIFEGGGLHIAEKNAHADSAIFNLPTRVEGETKREESEGENEPAPEHFLQCCPKKNTETMDLELEQRRA